VKPPRVRYPPQDCDVRCGRVSTVYPPGQGFICGHCYKRAPKVLRDRRAALGRKLARTRDPFRRWRLETIRARLVGRMVEALLARPVGDDMPPAVREGLRAAGLD